MATTPHTVIERWLSASDAGSAGFAAELYFHDDF
jgi:hypothetical protein